jgi:hypothetical protein
MPNSGALEVRRLHPIDEAARRASERELDNARQADYRFGHI